MSNSINEFLEKTEEQPNGCLFWTGRLDKDGYGRFDSDGKTHRAHVWHYEFEVGPLEYDRVLDHKCRNRPCVNVSHLEPVTIAVNVERGEAGKVNNRNAEKTHCKRGHEFTKANTYVNKKGHRTCRECLK